MVILQWVLIVLSVPLIVLMVIQTRKRARALDERIEEYKEEQEAAKSQPGPINPYDDLSKLIHIDPDRLNKNPKS
jgi:hypothetical protein